MTTGYTAGIADGTIATFDQFAWTCARGMGALIMMRDDPMGTPIPEAFQPHTKYYDTALLNAEADLEKVLAMPDAEAAAEAEREFSEAIAARADRETRRAAQQAGYEAMLASVKRWVPPTPDHDGLKDFMIQQLVESIDFDCRPPSERWDPEPKLEPVDDWRAAKLAELSKTIAYNRERRQSEIDRTEERNKWLRELRASLSPAQP